MQTVMLSLCVVFVVTRFVISTVHLRDILWPRFPCGAAAAAGWAGAWAGASTPGCAVGTGAAKGACSPSLPVVGKPAATEEWEGKRV